MYLATALRESFKEGYGIKNLKKDFVAGMVVSLVALPLSMALSIAVGLPPQHGIYTAIIAWRFAYTGDRANGGICGSAGDLLQFNRAD